MSHDPALDSYPDLTRKRWWAVPNTIGIFLILSFGLAVLAVGLWSKEKKINEASEQVSNGRQIMMAFYEFKEIYGKFPDATTAKMVEDEYGKSLRLDTKHPMIFFAS